jgi:hypothetical protein
MGVECISRCLMDSFVVMVGRVDGKDAVVKRLHQHSGMVCRPSSLRSLAMLNIMLKGTLNCQASLC